MFGQYFALAAIAAGAMAQTTLTAASGVATSVGTVFVSHTATISAYVGDGLVSGNAVSGAPCSTVLAVQCGQGGLQDVPYCAQATNFGVPFITLTAQPTGLVATGNTSSSNEIRSYSVTCSYGGLNTTNAVFASEVCTVSLSASISGLTTTTSTVITSTTPIALRRVIVTAGAVNLPNNATCTAAAATPTPGAAGPTALAEVYKILIPGAAIAAGVALL